MEKNEQYGYKCKCGRYHKYPVYVIAHMNIELIHTCDCGRKNIILNLVAVIGDLPDDKQEDKL